MLSSTRLRRPWFTLMLLMKNRDNHSYIETLLFILRMTKYELVPSKRVIFLDHSSITYSINLHHKNYVDIIKIIFVLLYISNQYGF